MLNRFFRILKSLTIRKQGAAIRPLPPSTVTTKNLQGECRFSEVKRLLSASFDVLFRDFMLQGQTAFQAHLVCVDGMVTKDLLNEFVLKPLMVEAGANPIIRGLTPQNSLNTVYNYLVTSNEVKIEKSLARAISAILAGDSALFFAETPGAIIIGSRGWESRGVAEPESETVVRGPREAFSETIRTNTSLLRRKIKSPDFIMQPLQIGALTRTDVVIAYIDGLADPQILKELQQRLKVIDIDAVLESGYLEELIEDMPYSPFPQIYHSERPDVVASHLLEGRIAILVDGTPTTLVVPALFIHFLQVSEDYYERAYTAILVRFIRLFGMFIALVLPSLYIAITTFHPEMIPTTLAISISASREGVPVPLFLEALAMEITLEILREAGLRLPRPTGQAIGIVGALVIGESAVRAGLVSPITVIVVSLTAIASFTTPTFNLGITIRLLRFPLMLLAATLGFFGLSLGLYGLLIHVCTLRSFGVPYLAPFAPGNINDILKDTVFRSPWWALRTRPRMSGKSKVSSGPLLEVERDT